jgi:hypothetical protein
VTGSSEAGRDTEQVDIKDTLREEGRGDIVLAAEKTSPPQRFTSKPRLPTVSYQLFTYDYSTINSTIIIHEYVTDYEPTSICPPENEDIQEKRSETLQTFCTSAIDEGEWPVL